MASLLAWLFRGGDGPEQKCSLRVESDEVVPVHFFDDTSINRQLFVCWTLRFEHVLDVDMLHDALVRLLDMGEWRKLGGRLRMNDHGKLELHIPRPFTPDRPAVRTSHAVHTCPIGQHPLASRLPQRTGPSCSLQPGPETFAALGCRPDMPTTLEEHLASDEPQLQLHSVSFTDATLVSLTWPHVASDAVGLVGLTRAWAAVLNGADAASVPRLLGVRDDALADLGALQPAEPSALAKLQLRGLALARFMGRFLLSGMIWPVDDSRTLFVSAPALALMRRRAASELAQWSEEGRESESATTETPFVSDGDLLTAWLTRTAALGSGVAATSDRPIMVHCAVDLRTRLSSIQRLLERSPTGVFVGNLIAPAVAVVPAQRLLSRPLGPVALGLRGTVAGQAREEELQGTFWALRQEYKRVGRSAIFGHPDAFWVFFTSWARCKVWDAVDFSAAVVDKGAASSSSLSGEEEVGDHGKSTGNKPGRPDYFHTFPVKTPPSPNGFQIAGKDALGNYWVVGNLHSSIWKAFEREIEELNRGVDSDGPALA